jgi:parallel beta-helix repeat protein
MAGSARRRRVAVIVLMAVTVLMAGGAGAGLAVAGSGPTPTAPHKPASLKAAGLAFEARTESQAKSGAAPFADATNVTCGETITINTTLNGDLHCAGTNGLTIGKATVTLNLGGHVIVGSIDVSDATEGVRTTFNSDTIENGVIYGFANGVYVAGATDTVTKLQVTQAFLSGVNVEGTADKITNSSLAENYGYGILIEGPANILTTSDTIQSNHVLDNGSYGIYVYRSGNKVLDNVANANTDDGIDLPAAEPLNTATGNVADYNGGLGIAGSLPLTDGGKNAAQGNTDSRQCTGVVCS